MEGTMICVDWLGHWSEADEQHEMKLHRDEESQYNL